MRENLRTRVDRFYYFSACFVDDRCPISRKRDLSVKMQVSPPLFNVHSILSIIRYRLLDEYDNPALGLTGASRYIGNRVTESREGLARLDWRFSFQQRHVIL